MKINQMKEIMVFRPSLEEFKDFKNYINYIESQGAHKMGIAKIIAPEGWSPRTGDYKDVNVLIPQPIKQKFIGSQGKYQINNIVKPEIYSSLFERLANTPRFRPPHDPCEANMDILERKYWKNINFNAPMYGADVSGSLYDKSQTIWDLSKLGTILEHMSEDYEACIDGVTTTYLYFGMWRSTFAWHTEDMDLYSINYLHFGAPKFWYAIPTQYGRKFERVIKLYFGGESEGCSNFLRHKSTLISPTLLQRHNIPYNKIQQREREFIITFPFGYHAGFNTGYNCAESTNFAMPRWIEYGKRAIQCNCRSGMVRFSMKCFVRRFQSNLLEAFERGEDVAPHPEDNHCNTRIHTGQKGIQANPIFDDPNYIISEPNEATEKQRMTSKRINYMQQQQKRVDDKEDEERCDDKKPNEVTEKQRMTSKRINFVQQQQPKRVVEEDADREDDEESLDDLVGDKKEEQRTMKVTDANVEKFWSNLEGLKLKIKGRQIKDGEGNLSLNAKMLEKEGGVERVRKKRKLKENGGRIDNKKIKCQVGLRSNGSRRKKKSIEEMSEYSGRISDADNSSNSTFICDDTVLLMNEMDDTFDRRVDVPLKDERDDTNNINRVNFARNTGDDIDMNKLDSDEIEVNLNSRCVVCCGETNGDCSRCCRSEKLLDNISPIALTTNDSNFKSSMTTPDVEFEQTLEKLESLIGKDHIQNIRNLFDKVSRLKR